MTNSMMRREEIIKEIKIINTLAESGVNISNSFKDMEGYEGVVTPLYADINKAISVLSRIVLEDVNKSVVLNMKLD
ncbi:MAG: hypothetical protein Q4B63_10715 [Clostridium perfringens]|nr:hypothetical protein [Clostridium perfringens]